MILRKCTSKDTIVTIVRGRKSSCEHDPEKVFILNVKTLLASGVISDWKDIRKYQQMCPDSVIIIKNVSASAFSFRTNGMSMYLYSDYEKILAVASGHRGGKERYG